MTSFDKSQTDIDAVSTHASVVMLSDVFNFIVLPGLKSAQNIRDGYYGVNRADLQAVDYGKDALFSDKDMCNDAMRIFGYLTLNPLAKSSKTFRSINLSSPQCIGESLVQIRRMLLVRSETNKHNLFSILNRSTREVYEGVTTSEDFKQLDINKQFQVASIVFFEIIRCIAVNHTGVVQVQIESDLQSNFRLCIWGNFKMK